MAKKQEKEKLTTFDMEVQDELKEDQLKNLWKTYGNILIGIVLSIIFFTAGSVIYENYEQSTKETEGKAYFALVETSTGKDFEQEVEKWSEYEQSADGGHKLLARMQKTKLFIANQKFQEAHELYVEIYSDSSLPPHFRNYALIRSALTALQMAEMPDMKKVKDDLALLSQNSSWSSLANEMLAWIALKEDEVLDAKNYLSQVILDQNASATMRKRAQNLLATIKDK